MADRGQRALLWKAALWSLTFVIAWIGGLLAIVSAPEVPGGSTFAPIAQAWFAVGWLPSLAVTALAFAITSRTVGVRTPWRPSALLLMAGIATVFALSVGLALRAWIEHDGREQAATSRAGTVYDYDAISRSLGIRGELIAVPFRVLDGVQEADDGVLVSATFRPESDLSPVAVGTGANVPS